MDKAFVQVFRAQGVGKEERVTVLIQHFCAYSRMDVNIYTPATYTAWSDDDDLEDDLVSAPSVYMRPFIAVQYLTTLHRWQRTRM